MPSALYRAGTLFFRNISTTCTMEAITRIKATVCMYPRFRGWSTKLSTAQQAAEAMAITKVTAMPIPRAVSIFLDTPIKGQMP